MIKKSIKDIIARYNELQPENGSKVTPRTGFYLIREVFESARFVTIYQAKALWKEHADDPFIEGAEVVIQLTSLQETSSDPESFNPQLLIDKVVHVQSTFPSEIKFQDKIYTIIKSNWTIDRSLIIINKPRINFFELAERLGLDQTLKSVNDSVGQDVADACINAEVEKNNMLDAYDDCTDTDDHFSWDAPEGDDNDDDESAVPCGADF